MWPQTNIFELIKLTIESAPTGCQELLKYLKGFIKTFSRFVLIDAKAFILATTKPTSDTTDDVSIRAQECIEHVDIFSYPYRIMPWKDNNHIPQINMFCDFS